MNAPKITSVEELLRREEGEKLTVYPDSLGYWTIGTGICVDSRVPGTGLRKEESDFITHNRVNLITSDLSRKYTWFFPLDSVRRAVVLSMVWQLGSLDGWPNFCNAMALRDYATAADHMLDSKVAKTEAPERWQRQAAMMKTGEWNP